ncbi:hypothetical protein TcasGA2_TC015924 [Tribolium castaneum]|uniref:Uncharacterized protein n=1 Tax=Tribolium castaneum TaxID=7070 RepID=D6WTU0_TRICA|nr:hypothetical protein TcasGA2_TC015924 [Tribolium castaneum]
MHCGRLFPILARDVVTSPCSPTFRGGAEIMKIRTIACIKFIRVLGGDVIALVIKGTGAAFPGAGCLTAAVVRNRNCVGKAFRKSLLGVNSTRKIKQKEVGHAGGKNITGKMGNCHESGVEMVFFMQNVEF